jgi:gamma-glutamylcyclotransferase (GGCT)/AIG2-like uncharacterized protein YtfP
MKEVFAYCTLTQCLPNLKWLSQQEVKLQQKSVEQLECLHHQWYTYPDGVDSKDL